MGRGEGVMGRGGSNGEGREYSMGNIDVELPFFTDWWTTGRSIALYLIRFVCLFFGHF